MTKTEQKLLEALKEQLKLDSTWARVDPAGFEVMKNRADERAKELIAKIEVDNHSKELSKGKIEIQLVNGKRELANKVIAVPFLNNVFAFHKSEMGLKGYSITHVSSGQLYVNGKQAFIKAAVKYLTDNESKLLHLEDIRELPEGKTLRVLPDDELAIMREGNRIGKYGIDFPNYGGK